MSEQLPRQPGEPRDDLMEKNRANWNRVPALLRQDCISSLREWLPPEALARFREEHAAGLRVGSTIPGFHHFAGGMAVRNHLRGVLMDEELPGVEYPDGQCYRNWDDFYLGVIEEMVEQIVGQG